MKVKLRLLAVFLVIFFCVTISLVIAALWHTHQAVKTFQQGQLTKSSAHIQVALPVVQFLNTLTLNKQPDLLIWEHGLYLLQLAPPLTKVFPTYAQQALASSPDAEATAQQLVTSIQTLETHLRLIKKTVPQTILIHKVLSPAKQKLLAQSVEAVDDMEKLLSILFSGDHTYLIIFQNSDELRATGGFMGSYQRLSLHQGAVTDLHIEDIYQPAGQVTTQLPPPLGVKEYLSSGNSWGLPDSNWDPNFITAAPTILRFFEAGKEAPAEGLIAVNLSLAEKLLDITGDIYLPDLGVTVTSQNLSSLARADRSQFFPGSRQKQHFLQSLFTQLKLKLVQLTPAQQLKLFQLVQEAIRTKSLQAFSQNTELQTLITKYHLDGAFPGTMAYIFPVESNVGINKANRAVSREFQLQLGPTTSQLTITFQNQNQSQPDPQNPKVNGGNYINYQRLLLPADIQVGQILIDGQPLLQHDEEVLTTIRAQKIRQIGFLLPVPAQKTVSVTFQLNHPLYFLTPEFSFLHQSGVPTSPLVVSNWEKEQTFILDQDLSITTTPSPQPQ